MKRIAEQKWFLWLTKYWFLFPVTGFLALAAGVFFGYGERSYIAVHDNMDLFLAQFQMLKNTGSFWKHGVDVPFLGGISRDNLPSELSLYSVLYMIFPTYTGDSGQDPAGDVFLPPAGGRTAGEPLYEIPSGGLYDRLCLRHCLVLSGFRFCFCIHSAVCVPADQNL